MTAGPPRPGWGSFTDYEGTPIPDAAIRVDFYESSRTPPGIQPDGHRRWMMDVSASTCKPWTSSPHEGHDDPWEPRHWTTTVYADKEGYATGATILDIQTPSIEPLLEIVSIDPPLDYLECPG